MIGHPRDGFVMCDATVIAGFGRWILWVRITDSGLFATCRPSGKMQRSRIAVVTGDNVVCEFAVDFLVKGRIVYRYEGERRGSSHVIAGSGVKAERERKSMTLPWLDLALFVVVGGVAVAVAVALAHL